MESKNNTPPQDGLLSGKLVHLALPVRWSLVERNGRGPVEMAVTYDIHPRGARLVGSREVNAHIEIRQAEVFLGVGAVGQC